MEITSEVCYGNVEGRSLLCLMAGWITGHLQGIWLALWFILGCCFVAHHHARVLSLAVSISSLNFQRKFKGDRMWKPVFLSKWWGISWFWVFAVPLGRALTCLQNVTRKAKSLKTWRGRYRPNHRSTVPKAFI